MLCPSRCPNDSRSVQIRAKRTSGHILLPFTRALQHVGEEGGGEVCQTLRALITANATATATAGVVDEGLWPSGVGAGGAT